MELLTVEQLEEKRRAARRAYIIYGLSNVAVLLVLLTRQLNLALALLALSLGYYFFLARPDIKGFVEGFRRTNLGTAYQKHLQNPVYHGKAGLAPEAVRGDLLLPVKPDKSCISFHRITGEARGMTVELSDVTFQVLDESEKARAQFVSGCWVRARLDHGTGLRLRLVSRMLVSDGLQRPYFRDHSDFRPMEWDREGVDREFCSYAPEGKLPRLSDSVMGRLMELVEYTPGAVAMGVEDDTVSFMLCRRFVTGKDPALKAPVTQAALEADPLPELDYILKICTAIRRMEAPGEQPGEDAGEA